MSGGIPDELWRELDRINRRIETLTRVEGGERIVARYIRNAAQSIPHNNPTRIDANVVLEDTHNAVTTGASWAFTAPLAGWYYVRGALLFHAFTWQAGMVAQLYAYNVTAGRIAILDRREIGADHTVATYMFVGGSALLRLARNEQAIVQIYQNTGAARNTFDNTSEASKFTYLHIARWNG